MSRVKVVERAPAVEVAADQREWNALAHLRGWCHDWMMCPICVVEDSAYSHGYDDAMAAVVTGVTEPLIGSVRRRIGARPICVSKS